MTKTLTAFAAEYARVIDSYILDAVQGAPTHLYDAALHLVRAGGKRLRPLIVILAARMVGCDDSKAIPVASAIELIHNFALIHDDIIDRDEIRRGVPTVHVVWGEPLAIIAGDLLFSKAFEVACELISKGVSPDRVVRVIKVLARASSTVAEGQAMDMDFEKRDRVTLEEYLEMIYKKTAALMEAASVAGGIVAGADEKVLEGLRAYGRSVGMAFQITDDILGVYGDPKKTGKPVYSDLREGKKTVVIIYALNTGDEGIRKAVLRVLGKPDAPEELLAKAADAIARSGALNYARGLAAEYSKKAVDALNKLGSVCDKNAKRALLELADFVVRRER